MGRKTYSPEKIVRKLLEAEVLISQDNTIARASRLLGITEQPYSRWRKQYGGMQVSQAKPLKELENENVNGVDIYKHKKLSAYDTGRRLTADD